MADETRPWRYHDQARCLGEELATIKVADPVPNTMNHGALDRIASGNTAFASMDHNRAANAAAVPAELQKHELKAKLQKLLDQKKVKTAQAYAKVAIFVDRCKHADPLSADAPLIGMSQGASSLSDVHPTDRRPSGMHQGPAANLLASQMAQARKPGQR